MTARPTAARSIRAHALAGLAVLALGVGGFAGFAVAVDLSAAVVAGGTVVPETHRKTVQHLEGGIVAAVLVRDADRVEAGDVLLRMDGTRAEAATATLRNQIAAALAKEARLAAEAALADRIDFPAALAALPGGPARREAETRVFDARRLALAGQVEILAGRRVQLADRAVGLEHQKAALSSQIASLSGETAGLEALAAKGFFPKSRLADHKREIVRLTGLVGETEAQIAANAGQQSDMDLQALQARQAFRERAVDELAEAAAARADLEERLRVAEDALSRLEVRAPVAGAVQGLRVSAAGAVLRPGEPVLDIVPDADALVVAARIPVTAIDDLSLGMAAELRFPNFDARSMPTISGRIVRLSADAVFDEATRTSAYLADVAVDLASLPPAAAGRLQPGMPAEVIVPTRARSLADYIAEPLARAFRHSMRES